jgi:hypothetical protein
MSGLYTNKIVFNKHNYIRSRFAGRGTGGPLAALWLHVFLSENHGAKPPETNIY